ncbi:DUF1638 domain-containing protein [Geobacter argillaceus]|uniref:Uncharacterized protein DUF1638 n=1 Tax=Geobacter argillaceus TaxID=345631 RepID=A0A562VM33_9BACT|nr:DUF1638 domain-containing protein [Geobacter argillaceus]TWJ18979.1 uncharacterized protein DUF1638 [Geobacter argillaceus]
MSGNDAELALLIGCGILRAEILFLIEKNHWPLEAVFLPSSLHVDFEQLENSLRKALALHSGRRKVIFYGTCHPRMDSLIGTGAVVRTEGQNCIDMLLGRERFTRELATGAFFLLEDWAEHWEQVIHPVFESNQEAIRAIFTSEHRRLMAIRTPCSADFTAKAKKVADITGLALEWIDVTLDKLEQCLRTALDRLGAVP